MLNAIQVADVVAAVFWLNMTAVYRGLNIKLLYLCMV